MDLGFTKEEEDTTDSNRLIWYTMTFDPCDSNVRFKLVITFDLSISDNPEATWIENCLYSWKGCHIEVVDRQMVERRKEDFDEDTEDPRTIGIYPLSAYTLEEITSLTKTLGKKPSENR